MLDPRRQLPPKTHDEGLSTLATVHEGWQSEYDPVSWSYWSCSDHTDGVCSVWGGGIYEDEAFYSTCDELGLLVWQDFMFACGNYPAWPDFLENIEKEASYNLRKLRHHPCIVIYAGANEDYQVQEQYGLDSCDSKDPQDWLKSNFPARYIYEHLLPNVISKHTPSVSYWPCSPFTAAGKLSSDLKAGDAHQWNGETSYLPSIRPSSDIA